MSAEIYGSSAVKHFRITLFPNQQAASKREINVNIDELVQLIAGRQAPAKDRLPWLKLATFGDNRSDRNCLRNDANVLAVTGAEIDYDGEVVAFTEARRRLRSAGVLAVLYTSASYTIAAPRWRALLPFSAAKPPDERRGWALRAGQLLGIEVGQDSLTLSQAYHYGRVVGTLFEIAAIAGEPIDQRCEPVPVEAKAPELVGEYRECTQLTRHGEAALRSATNNILMAPKGEQERTLNTEAYCIGQAAAAGIVPAALALEVLVIAANGLKSLDPRRPWRPGEAEGKARRAFHQGWGRPRPTIDQLERELQRSQDEWAAALGRGEAFHAE
jgi:hypothetical protein